MTTIAHCKYDIFDRYIGRTMPQFPKGSIFGNPYVIGKDGTREEVIRKHKEWIFGLIEHPTVDRPSISDIMSLRGQTLGCWCRRKNEPKTQYNHCHGDLYAELADSKSYLEYCFSKTAHSSWKKIMCSEFDEKYMIALSSMLSRIDVSELCPLPHRIFRAFRLPFAKIKVVIVGQDPYPNTKHANGLAFAYAGKDSWPKSLRNVFRECGEDQKATTFDPTLVHWMRQGVFLINTSLTTIQGKPGSHSAWGWQDFTELAVNRISYKKNIVFLLWGKHAQSLKGSIEPGNLILEAAHPSPFSCKDFFGCRHFSKTNSYLAKHNLRPIDWNYDIDLGD